MPRWRRQYLNLYTLPCHTPPCGVRTHPCANNDRELREALAQAESERDEARAQKKSAEAEAVKARDSAKSAKESAKAAKAGSETERAKTDTEIE